ncbi:hypothetical protein [Dactylosporangium sp. CA-092794]|uniref:hypothetical protein n=1 Tax=Dactylosporangium sp. CA-092794 TaxID=3239929 RepID=UPI003D8BFCB4
MGPRSARASRVTVAALLVPALLAGACSGGPDIKPGADVDAAGPHYTVSAGPPGAPATATPVAVQQPAPGSSSPKPSGSAGAPGTVDGVRAAVVQAMSADDLAAASTVAVEQRPAAQNQLVFTWTVSSDPDDTEARDRVREQALLILQQAKLSGLPYGSVLLIANASVRDSSGRKTQVAAVRAKYSRALVLGTDFTKVSPADVFKLPDDKPAEIDPHFK